MPGYEMNRFSYVKETDLDEFMCGICHEVFNNPLSTLCCGQTYCSDCINSWISQKNSCPMDRRPLISRNLIQPPKALKNLLNKLEIKCDYESRGCPMLIALGDLPVHINNCKFNPANFCQTCGLANDVSHDCLSILKTNIERLNSEMNRLREQNSSLKQIVEINTNVNENSISILKSLFPKQIEEKVIQISKEALKKCRGSRVEMAKYIAQNMDTHFGVGWNCFVSHHSYYGSVVKAYKYNYIQFIIGSNEVLIYKTHINYSNKLFIIAFILIFIYLIRFI